MLRLSNLEIDALYGCHQMCSPTSHLTLTATSSVSGKPIDLRSHRYVVIGLTSVTRQHINHSSQFDPHTIRASYISHDSEKVEEKYEVRTRNLMECVRELLQDAKLASRLHWYPTKKYICSNGESKRFLDDLECGEDWWGIQVCFDHVDRSIKAMTDCIIRKLFQMMKPSCRSFSMQMQLSYLVSMDGRTIQ
jgi:hypothetical protein